jgi:DNA processing protein
VGDEERARVIEKADRLLDARGRVGAGFVLNSDTTFPEQLQTLADPPAALWFIGQWETLRGPVVAIVGTRTATTYGERIARELASALARAGACIVSGMARGIDGVAHRAALDAGGRTAAVLGTGVDVVYPAAHRTLHRHIAERGLLLSELPLGERSTAGSFPRRNRIIAGLAHMTIVVEAPVRSGALITAGDAEASNRIVAAVPGPIDSPQSEGTNLLIRDGAQIITSVADALALVGLTPPVRSTPRLETDDESRLWRALADGPADIDGLCHRAALPAQRCLAAVTALELRGAVECALTGEIRRR